MKYFLPLALVTTVGCVSDIEPLHDYGEFAPVNVTNEGWLTISYLNEGADSVVEGRRKDAYKKMYKHCNGKYELRSASSSGGKTSMYADGNNVYAWTSGNRRHFVFRCV